MENQDIRDQPCGITAHSDTFTEKRKSFLPLPLMVLGGLEEEDLPSSPTWLSAVWHAYYNRQLDEFMLANKWFATTGHTQCGSKHNVGPTAHVINLDNATPKKDNLSLS